MAFTIGAAVLSVVADYGPLAAGLAAAEALTRGRLGGMASASRVFGDSLRDVGRGAVYLGASLTAVGVVGKGLFNSITGEAGNFEQAITNAVSVSGYFGEELQKVKQSATDTAIALGKDLPVSARDVADVMTDLAQRGFDSVTASANELRPVIELSVATMEQQSTVTAVLTTTLNTYGYGLESAAKVSDILAQSTISTAGTISYLNTAFNLVGPIAAQTGIKLEETTSVLGVLANNGIKASTAGQSLRSMIVELSAPSKNLTDVMEKLGLTQDDLNFKTKGFVGVMKTLKDAGITAEDVYVLFNKTAAASALTVLGLGDNSNKTMRSINDLTRSLQNADGTTKRLAGEQMNTLNMQMQVLSEGVDAVWIRIGQALSPVLMELVGYLQEVVGSVESWVQANPALIQSIGQGLVENVKAVVEWVREWVKENQKMIPQILDGAVKFMAFGAALGPVILVLGGVVGGLANILSFIPSVLGILPVVGAAFFSWTTVLALVSAALVNFGLGLPEVQATISEFWEGLMRGSDGASAKVDSDVTKMGAAVRDGVTWMVETWGIYVSSLAETITTQEMELGRGLSGWEKFWTGVEVAWGMINWPALVQIATDSFKFWFEWMKQNWIVAWGYVQGFVDKWVGIWPYAKQVFMRFLSEVSVAFSNKIFEWTSSIMQLIGMSAPQSNSTGIGGYGAWQGVPYAYASGGYTQGAFQRINEKGGEIVALPNKSFVIPHDVSMAMAKSGMGGGGGGVTVNVGTLAVREEADVRRVAEQLYTLQKSEQRNRGY